MSAWRTAVGWIATGFGLGLSPLASGTVGSLWGVWIVWASFPRLAVAEQALLACLLALVAIPICDIAERGYGTKDDGRIVADEFLTFPLCLIGLPAQSPVMLGAAFLTCRALDIIKPPPARQAQHLRGGLGIVLDDVISSLMSLALNHLLYAAFLKSLIQ
jgi:phosphatidylglycerophosphatase A